jgi:hypothetical protein
MRLKMLRQIPIDRPLFGLGIHGAVAPGLSLLTLAIMLLMPGTAGSTGAGNIISTPHPGQTSAVYSSLVLDGAGNPVVSYTEIVNDDLKLLHCNDPFCVGGDESITTPDSFGFISFHTSLALDLAGNPVIAYFSSIPPPNFFQGLTVMHCDDPNCSSGAETITHVDSGTTSEHSLQLNSAGLPVVAYKRFGEGLKLLSCDEPDCSTGNTISVIATAGSNPSLVLDEFGHPVVAFIEEVDANTQELRVLHCGSADCTSGNTLSAPDATNLRDTIAVEIVLDSSGNPTVSYYDGDVGVGPPFDGNLRLLTCGDSDCSTGNSIAVPDGPGDVAWQLALALDASDNPIVAYTIDAGEELRVLHCGNPACTTGNVISAPDQDGLSYGQVSLVLDAAGNPVVTYQDATKATLSLLHCGDPNCEFYTDTDSDGCNDSQEKGQNATLGGQRDYLNPWDYFDTNADQIIDLPNDVLGVVFHYAPSGTEPTYDIAFDRGPSVGPNPWNMTAPDGVIDLSVDILGVVLQYQHSCQ